MSPASVAEVHERRCAQPFVMQLPWTENVTVITLTTRGVVSMYVCIHICFDIAGGHIRSEPIVTGFLNRTTNHRRANKHAKFVGDTD